MKKQLLQLCYEIEKLPASEQQTKVSLMASELHQQYQSPEKYCSSGEYLQDTPPLMFIEDLHDIMVDGDCLTPDKLVADVVQLIKDYLAAQHGVQRTGDSWGNLGKCTICGKAWQECSCLTRR
jgi:hypothetical protein